MRRPWAVASLIVGCALLVYAGFALALDLGGPEVSETLGGMALILGLFLAGEGSLALRRAARLEALRPRDKS